LEVFGLLVDSGGTGVVISSMAAHLADNLAPDQERKLALTPTDELLELPFVDPNRIQDPGTAYVIAKRANQLRVQAASIEWGARGARINSISPGIVSTSMGRQELSSESGPLMRGLIDGSAAHRVGTPGDIASAAAFLLGADSAFITGTDLLVDGGVVAAFRSLGTGGS
jgi:NAD(P)-dependent dehydrogenase (short-subunit alcohol dehydrogenase family)